MRVVIITDLDKFPLLNKEKDSYWTVISNTIGGVYWVDIRAEDDIKKAGIDYTIGEVEIKEDDLGLTINPTDE